MNKIVKNINLIYGNTYKFDVSFTNVKSEITDIELEIKANRNQPVADVVLHLGSNIIRIGANKYLVFLDEEKSKKLKGKRYLYEMSIKYGDDVRTPLIGKINVLEAL